MFFFLTFGVANSSFLKEAGLCSLASKFIFQNVKRGISAAVNSCVAAKDVRYFS